MSGMGMMILAGTVNLVVQNTSAGLRNITAGGPATLSASVTFNSDGTMGVGGSGSSSPRWYSVTTTGIGSMYWIKFTVTATSNSNSTGTTGWLSMASGVTWSVSNTPSGAEGTGSGTYQIAADSLGASVMGSGSFGWDVGYTP